MKVVLFCGGYGMRMREFSESIPKPMVPIGDRPVLWHIMKYYAHFGHTDFILCLGYKGHTIKRYFLEYDETVSNDFVMANGGRDLKLLGCDIRDWTITFVDTGLETNIGGRLRQVRSYLEGEETFLANYSDGLTDFPLPRLVERVESNGAVGGFLAVRPPYSFHVVDVEPEGTVRAVRDLTRAELRINGGYFVLRNEIFDYLGAGEELVNEPFQRLAEERRLTACPYDGFWMSMDTFKEKQRLDEMYARGRRPWQLWNVAPVPVLEGALPSLR
jgi:glucose-1-phosphate cytidylyltransferase